MVVVADDVDAVVPVGEDVGTDDSELGIVAEGDDEVAMFEDVEDAAELLVLVTNVVALSEDVALL